MKGSLILVFYSLYLIVVLIALSVLVKAYSLYGSPAEFGNATNTTCWIGGDPGILNCTGNIYGKNIYVTNVSGSINSSNYWDSLDVPSDLNYLILLSWPNITGRITHLSNLTDDLGNRGYSHLSNFTDNLNYSNKSVNRSDFWDWLDVVSDLNFLILSHFTNITGRPTHLSNFTDDLNYSSKAVNKSSFWDDFDIPTDLNYRLLLYFVNISGRPTHLSNFSNDLNLTNAYTLDCSNITGAASNLCTITPAGANITHLSNLTDDLNYSNKTVNQSNFWDQFDVPTDLNFRLLLYFVNISGRPTHLTNFTDDIDYLNKSVNNSVFWGNRSTSEEWISPAQILDVDDEDVESDLNTYVDIAGDTMVGSLIAPSINAVLDASNLSNIPFLNYLILLHFTNISGRPTHLSNFTNNININASNVSNEIWIEESNESKLNVNSSNYWDFFDVPSDLNYRLLLYFVNITGRPTHLSNFTNNIQINASNLTNPFWVLRSGDNMTGSLNVSANVSAQWFFGNGSLIQSINCSSIIGGNDTDFCADLSGGAGGGTFSGTLNASNVTSGTFSGVYNFSNNVTITKNINPSSNHSSNLGSNATRWGNISLGVNQTIYLGEGGKIYYDGAKLVIKAD